MWPNDDFSAVTQMSPRAPPNAFFSASFSARSPWTVAVAWALTQEMSDGPIPAARSALPMASAFHRPVGSGATRWVPSQVEPAPATRARIRAPRPSA